MGWLPAPRVKPRRLAKFALIVVILFLNAACVAACGVVNGSRVAASDTVHGSAKAAVHGSARRESESNALDRDDGRVPNDDTTNPTYFDSHYKVTVVDRREVVKLIKRYYVAARAGDGLKACSLLTAVTAKALPEDYGQAPGPAYLRGKTCAVVVSKIFKHLRREIRFAKPILKVESLRLYGGHGRTVLGVGEHSELKLEFLILREHGLWKVDGPPSVAS